VFDIRDTTYRIYSLTHPFYCEWTIHLNSIARSCNVSDIDPWDDLVGYLKEQNVNGLSLIKAIKEAFGHIPKEIATLLSQNVPCELTIGRLRGIRRR
jgi:hypothetical protein